MDANLRERLSRIEEQIEAVYAAEEDYLTLDAAKDHKLAQLIAAHDEDLSMTAREKLAFAEPEWLKFRQALAKAEAFYHKQKHKLTLKEKAYDAEHISLKIETSAIRRQL